MGEVMGILGVLLGILGFCSVVIYLKRRSKQNIGMVIGASLLFFVAGCSAALTTPPTLGLTQEKFETDGTGHAVITGETEEDATITINGEKVKVTKEKFAYEVTLLSDQSEEFTVVATKEGEKTTVEVKVEPSKEFIAFLQKEREDQQIEAAEKALLVAEKRPSQNNYDEAATLVRALANEHDSFNQRLKIVEENIPIYAAVRLAEKELSRKTLNAAKDLIVNATLHKEGWTDRLATVQQKIEEEEQKKQAEKQLADAKSAVKKAEKTPNEANYNAALAKVNSLPKGNQDLRKRLNAVQKTIDKQKQKAVERANANQQQSSKQTNQQANQQTNKPTSQQNNQVKDSQPANTATVLVTPTGSKYHRQKCGNGNYTPATLDAAKQRGLTPCAKCY